MNLESIEQSKFEIVEAVPEHAEQILDIQKETWIATYPNVKLGITEEQIEKRFENKEERIEKWKNKIESDESKVWVIKLNGSVVGFCGVEGNEIASLYVRPDCQGAGVGSALITAALEHIGRGQDTYLNVASYNESTISFYEKFGFKVAGKVDDKHQIEIGGVKLPEVRMILQASL